MSKLLVSFLSVLVLVGAGCTTTQPVENYQTPAANEQPAEQQNTISTSTAVKSDETKPAETSPTETKSTTAFTMTEVAKHNSVASCYTVVRGSVYDVTNWVGKHPGGEEAIMKLCGKDGTSLFEGVHGGKDRQENVLASFKIGELAK